MNSQFNITDKTGRVLLKVKGDRILVARFPNMSDNMKNTIIEFYTELTGEEPDRIKGFLEFKNEEMEFCS